MSDRGKIAEWLTSRASKSPIEIDLRHQRGDKVESFELEENESVEGILDRIYDAATDDAKGMMGPQAYWLEIRSVESKEVLGRKSITVDGEMHEKGRGSESPDEWGLTAQAMRHMEGVLKMTLNAINQSAQNQQRENERMAAQLTEHSRTEIERMAMQRQLNQDVANQRVEEARIIAQSKRDEWLMRQVEVLIPIGASKLLGEGQAGPVWAKETETLLTLVKVLRPDQLDRVMVIFDGPSRAGIMALAQGEISMAFAPLMVQRIMSALQPDQYAAIFRVLETDEQKMIFRDLFAVRKHGIEWAEAQASEPPQYLPSLSSPPAGGSSSSNGTLPTPPPSVTLDTKPT
jgi:hypothetical protein